MSSKPPRYVCVHGHFYQPPRENPWLEAVEVQDSAAPFHDWNERITRECYAPNGRARLVDHRGKIIDLINNYVWMSFNFGPTLLSWMADLAPDALGGIVEGDRLSRVRRGGHGNALAQVYNHAIMPLAGELDKRTQVLWGMADFRARFGREPEGMWLAETAADAASLEALASAGIRFTILAPRQARRWRKIGDKEWLETPEGIDPSRAYLCRLPSGKSIAIFFYEGNLSKQVAFERLLDRGEKFLERLMRGFDDRREHAQLVHIATDGESYGHHHAHGDMALAYVLSQLAKSEEVKLTNYGEFLERHPPEWEAEIHDNSSWSCVHGVERWRANCGCNMGRGWQQEWRGPLRDAFNRLKEQLDRLFEEQGGRRFADPWAARDAYVEVLLDREEESVRDFLHRHGKPGLDEAGVRDALWLLEMQRHGMLMFTSCGWFFDEISGLETTQCLRYAARAMQLARHFDADFEDEFVARLEKAPSNVPEYANGRGVWEKVIRRARVDLDRVLAHHAMSLIYSTREEHRRIYCYDVDTLDQEVLSRGGSHLAIGRLKIRSRLTWNEAETVFVVIHYGGLDFHTLLHRAGPALEYLDLKRKLAETYETGSLADVTALAAREFEGHPYRLDDLFREEQRRIIGIVLQDRFEDYQRSFEQLADQDEDMLNHLGRLQYPIPKALVAAAAVCLDQRLREELAQLETDGVSRVRSLYERGKAWGYQPERELLAKTVSEELRGLLSEINPSSDLTALAAQAIHLLDAAALLELHVDVWPVQQQLLDAFGHLTAAGPLEPPVRDAFNRLADRLNLNPALLGWRP